MNSTFTFDVGDGGSAEPAWDLGGDRCAHLAMCFARNEHMSACMHACMHACVVPANRTQPACITSGQTSARVSDEHPPPRAPLSIPPSVASTMPHLIWSLLVQTLLSSRNRRHGAGARRPAGGGARRRHHRRCEDTAATREHGSHQPAHGSSEAEAVAAAAERRAARAAKQRGGGGGGGAGR